MTPYTYQITVANSAINCGKRESLRIVLLVYSFSPPLVVTTVTKSWLFLAPMNLSEVSFPLPLPLRMKHEDHPGISPPLSLSQKEWPLLIIGKATRNLASNHSRLTGGPDILAETVGLQRGRARIIKCRVFGPP